MSYYEDYEEYDEMFGRGGFQKSSKTKKMRSEEKPKKDKHIRKNTASEWEELTTMDDGSDNFTTPTAPVKPATPTAGINKPTGSTAPATTSPTGAKTFTPGPNTHTITLGRFQCQIDFDRVYSITKVEENSPEGKTRYGVKFEFKGTKGLSRTVWYHSKADRDALHDEKYAFWTSLPSCPLNKNK